MKHAAYAALALLVFCARASAESSQELYLEGKYPAAIAAGIAQKDAAGWTSAARAELASEMMRPKPCIACLRRAEADAFRAIKLDPKNGDAHLYAAVAVGYESRLMGIVAAAANHNAPRAKAELDAALACEPANSFVLAALGGWHVEIVRAGGASMAKFLYSANVPEGLADFDKGFALNPGNVALRYQYALILSGYDLQTFRPQIENALSLAATGKTQGAYEAFVQIRARELLDVLKKNDLERYDQLVRRDQGYAD
jgi:hypothetical protein